MLTASNVVTLDKTDNINMGVTEIDYEGEEWIYVAMACCCAILFLKVGIVLSD
jgi:hypothetical protein